MMVPVAALMTTTEVYLFQMASAGAFNSTTHAGPENPVTR